MRVRKMLGWVAAVALVAACAEAPPSRSERFALLAGLGFETGDAVERGDEVHFPLGKCGAVLHYFDGRPQLDVFMGESSPLEVLYGDDMKKAGKTGATLVCTLDAKPTPPSGSAKVETSESK